MKAQTGGVEIYLHFFFDLGAGWGWVVDTLPSGRWATGKENRYPFYKRLCGPQGRSGRGWKILSSPGFDPWTVQPAMSCNTDYAILAHWQITLSVIKLLMVVTYCLYYYSKIHNGALCGIYRDSYATNYPQLPSFTDVVRNPRYRSGSVLNQINPVPTFTHVSLWSILALRFKAFRAVHTYIAIVWDVTTCSLVKPWYVLQYGG